MNNDAYAAALAEIEEGRLDKGTWARALAESGGDDAKAKAYYIKARAELKSDSPAWPDTQPPVEDAPKHHAKSASAPTISLSEQTKLYEPALGEKNLGYYLAKFLAFDDKGTGLNASWNWPAFFFTGFWALYRKMYGWFFAWWAVATVVTVFEKTQNAQIHQFLAVVSVVSWLGFATYANSLYHRKIKKRIASAQRSHSDASRISGILSASSGVNKWVPIVCGAVPVIGVVASIALPAYQDYTKRQPVAAEPVQAPVPQVDWSYTPVPTQAPVPQAAWSGNPFDKFDDETKIAVRASQFPQLREPRAWAAVLAWQQSNMRADKSPANEALYNAVGTVLDGLKDNKGVCRPGQIEIVSATQASNSMPAGTQFTLLDCDR